MPAKDRSQRTSRQVVVVVILAVLLALLGVAYYLLTRPAELKGQGERDRRFQFSIYGFEGDLLRRPSGVAFDSTGRIYVADTDKHRIVVFDSRGGYVTNYGQPGKAAMQINEPISIAVAPDGTSYVADKSLKKLVIYDPMHKPTREIVFAEEPPTSVAVANGQLFITTDSGVLISDLKGNIGTGYVRRGRNPGEFDRPAGVAVGTDGTLYIADSLNYRVQAVSTAGKPLWHFGNPLPPDAAVQYQGKDRLFGLPASIALDDNGKLYVVDGLSSEIVVLDTSGTRLESWGDVGHADGTFYYPESIAYSNGRLAVADKFNDRVEVFSVPVPLSRAWRSYAPYALLLLLLPLVLLPFLRRRTAYVAMPDFVTAFAADDERRTVAEGMRRVLSVDAVAEAGSAIDDPNVRWVVRETRADDVERLRERFPGLAPDAARTLAAALGVRSRVLVVTDDPEARAALEELGVPSVTYEEIRGAVSQEPPAEVSA